MLQAQAAQEIANQVRVQLGPEERERLEAAGRVNADAYLAFLRGVFHVERFNPEDMRIAATHFQRAVDLDPEFALGHWGLGKLCGFQTQAGMLTPAEGREQCLPPIMRALELDPFLAEAHMGLASNMTWQQFDWASARPHWERAIELNPSYAEAHMFYSHYLGIIGELEKSTYHIERAVELDPHNPFLIGLYSVQLVMCDEYELAIETAERALQMDPGNPFSYITIGRVHDTLGNQDESIAAFATLLRHVANRPEAADFLEAAYARDGYQSASLQLAEMFVQLAETSHVPALTIARLYEQGEDYEQAMDWLEIAYERFDPDSPYIGVNVKDPELRSLPRFAALLRRMGLDYWADNL